MFGIFLGLAGFGLLVLALHGPNIEWTWEYWGDNKGNFDRSAILRNFGLLIVAICGLLLASWRSWTAHRQADTANRQQKVFADQYRLAEKGQIVDRFQKGSAMLESNELSVRLAGIYALRELAMSDPEVTYITVQDLLCDFVREKSNDREPENTPLPMNKGTTYGPFPPDLQRALDTFSWLRDNVQDARELEENWSAKLAGANLSKVNLFKKNLAGTNLVSANLSEARLFSANLSSASLRETNLFKAKLGNANLSKADLSGASLIKAVLYAANLSDAHLFETDLSGAKLYEANVSGAIFLHTTLDNETGLEGIWAWDDHPPKDLSGLISNQIDIHFRDEDQD